MHQAEEDLLVLAAQSGNQKAFNLIYKNYHKALLRFAYKISGDQEIAQDAVQEAWIKTSSGIRKINDPRAFRGWLYRLVRWRTTDLLRQTSRHKNDTEVFDDDKHGESLEASVNQSDELNAAINRLPPLEKQMVHLFYLDELKVGEIAMVLDIPGGTVKSRLNRARKLLKQKFDI